MPTVNAIVLRVWSISRRMARILSDRKTKTQNRQPHLDPFFAGIISGAAPGHHRGATAKDSENRRIPFDPHGRIAPILKRRASLGPNVSVFGRQARFRRVPRQEPAEAARAASSGLLKPRAVADVQRIFAEY
jgi:hypothetical protein